MVFCIVLSSLLSTTSMWAITDVIFLLKCEHTDLRESVGNLQVADRFLFSSSALEIWWDWAKKTLRSEMTSFWPKSEIFFHPTNLPPSSSWFWSIGHQFRTQKNRFWNHIISGGIWSHSVPISLWNERYHWYFHFSYDFFEIRSRFLGIREDDLYWRSGASRHQFFLQFSPALAPASAPGSAPVLPVGSSSTGVNWRR